ncbi:unnamed protein product [Effrenium voratum]|nr:unnamed protein product [Effrenium voratum]
MPLGVWDWGLVRCWLTPRAACLQLPNRPLRFGRKSLGVAQSLVPFTRATHFGYLFLTHTTGGDSLAWLFARLRLPLEYMEKAGDFCQQHNLKLHVDGARLWNAAVALKVPLKEVVRRADSVSICFSKGLGAPVGSVLCGPTDFIAKARRLRKAVGGGLRQVGVLAAAQLYALDHNLERLHEDHENASRLAAGLKALGLHVLPAPTNIVFFDVDEAPQVVASLGQRGVRILCTDGRRRCRAVTHLHIRSKDIDYFLTQISEILSK